MQIRPEQSSPTIDGLRRLGGSGGGGGGNGRVVALALLSAAVALVLWEVASDTLNPWEQQQLLSRRLVHAVVGGPLPTVGPLLAPWERNRSCLVYILDASEELAPAAGVPQCNINDPEVRCSGY